MRRGQRLAPTPASGEWGYGHTALLKVHYYCRLGTPDLTQASHSPVHIPDRGGSPFAAGHTSLIPRPFPQNNSAEEERKEWYAPFHTCAGLIKMNIIIF